MFFINWEIYFHLQHLNQVVLCFDKYKSYILIGVTLAE